jgi:undecaprenyl-diphosphatase
MVLEFITAGDYNLMRRVNRWPAPRWIRVWMICATRGGDGWLWYAMGLIILLFGGPTRFAAVGTSAVAAALGIAVFLFLKKCTNRKRPCAIEPHCWAKLLPPDRFSFPSCAASIALSRILLGMHFLSDVIAGALVGSGLAYGAVWLIR